MEIDILKTLESFFLDNKGNNPININLENVDNPGWFFDLSLNFFDLHLKNDEKILKMDRSDADWIHLFLRDNTLYFACSERNLIESFNLLFDYLKKYLKDDFIKYGNNNTLKSYENWYAESCNEDWEHSAGTDLKIIDNKWVLKVEYYDLIYNYEDFKCDSHFNSENDYYKYDLEDYHRDPDEKIFVGSSSLNNLHKLFEGFIYNLTFLE